MGTWNHYRSQCSRRWGLPLQTQALLYRTIIQPQASAVYFPGMRAKNMKDLQTFQNKVIRSILQNCLSPSIPVAEFLLGTPPVSIFGKSLNDKFLIKTKQKGLDLISTANDEAVQLQGSTSHILQRGLGRYQKQMAPNKDPLEYSAKSIADFVIKEWTNRWKSPYSLGFLKNFRRFVPEIGTTSPLPRGNPNKANKIAALLFGNSLEYKEMKWKLSRAASPNCECKSSKENA